MSHKSSLIFFSPRCMLLVTKWNPFNYFCDYNVRFRGTLPNILEKTTKVPPLGIVARTWTKLTGWETGQIRAHCPPTLARRPLQSHWGQSILGQMWMVFPAGERTHPLLWDRHVPLPFEFKLKLLSPPLPFLEFIV